MAHLERVIALVDMDCFYCQVEENLDASLIGKPIAVVQYNAWRGGGIIAVNYPARDHGVTRHMRGNEAKEKCPNIQLVRVPNVRGKADLSKYREAGKRVAEVLQSFTSLLERASVDEAYLDITDQVIHRLRHVNRIHPDQLRNTHIVGYDDVDGYLSDIYSNELMNESNIKLAWGGVIAEEIRAAVFEITGYKCSAGVGHNKILAKLVAGMHKPNQQTILPHASVPILFESMPVRKVRSLGGKFGNHISEKLDIKNMGELYKYTEKELSRHFDDKTASWLYNIARGIDKEPVTVRLVSKSIGCCKKFPGRTALTTHGNIKHWLNELAIEISERLEKDLEENNRRAKQMVVNFAQEVNKKDISASRTHILTSYDVNKITSDAYEVIKKHCLRSDDTFCVKFLGISVGKFEDIKNGNDIMAMFKNCSRKSDGSESNGFGVGSETNSKINDSSEGVKTVNDMTLFQNCHKKSENIESNEISYNSLEYVKIINDSSDDCKKVNLSSEDSKSTDNSPLRNFKKKSEIDNSSSSKEPSFFTNYLHEPTQNKTIEEDEESEDSITEEIQQSICDKDSTSFFNKYIEKLHVPIERNFNTSVVLKQEFDMRIDEILNNEVDDLETPGTSRDDGCELCSECDKRIPFNEMVSHMDYHFVLKIVRDEADLYKPVKIVKPKAVSPKKGNKRKSKNSDSYMKLTAFFAGNKSDNLMPLETCQECNKGIPIEDFASHSDYHVAKRIHLELNPVHNIICDNKSNNVKKCDDKSGKLGVTKDKLPSIATFFKPI